ncbi:PREDICTED: neurocalcin homolog [Branchiostoma belcheri]|uniref:Neurocalcin homolog n=1 Tax=Branchiostoma belcheri TaxID=7741 RepID=A0A6P4Y6M1_BRABE|nr:PREDICTED: neurocalcin homolog [Branchiostoma belcheri]
MGCSVGICREHKVRETRTGLTCEYCNTYCGNDSGSYLDCLAINHDREVWGWPRRARTRPSKQQRDRLISDLTRTTNFRESEIKHLYKLFQKDCPNGLLKEQQFVRFYVDFFRTGCREKKATLAKRIFRAFDHDATGTVDFREYVCGMSALLRGSKVEKLKWAFRMYDLDGNGEVTKRELLNVLMLMNELRNPGAPEEETRQMEVQQEELITGIFNSLDIDHDGKLQLKEFVEGVRRKPELFKIL